VPPPKSNHSRIIKLFPSSFSFYSICRTIKRRFLLTIPSLSPVRVSGRVYPSPGDGWRMGYSSHPFHRVSTRKACCSGPGRIPSPVFHGLSAWASPLQGSIGQVEGFGGMVDWSPFLAPPDLPLIHTSVAFSRGQSLPVYVSGLEMFPRCTQ
jgi:hypothetical protein